MYNGMYTPTNYKIFMNAVREMKAHLPYSWDIIKIANSNYGSCILSV